VWGGDGEKRRGGRMFILIINVYIKFNHFYNEGANEFAELSWGKYNKNELYFNDNLNEIIPNSNNN